MSSANDAPRRSLITTLWGSSAVRYVVVGGFCFLVDAGLIWLLHDVAHWPIEIATPVAFLTSFVVTFTLQRTFAFESKAAVPGAALRYTALVAFNTLATTAIVWGIDALGPPWIIGKTIAVVVTTVWNYFVYRYWVFPPVKDGITHV